MWKKEEGIALVLVALAFPVFLVLLGLVVDVGYLYYQRVRLINTVDAAALAGVQELPYSSYEAHQVAREYTLMNHPLVRNLSTQVDDTASQIEVTVQLAAPVFFLRILGIEEVTLSARSKAQVGSISGYNNVVPLGVVQQHFQFGQQYYLKLGTGEEGDNQQGNFGAVALGGRGASTYLDNLVNGYRDWVRVGDLIFTETGNMAGPTIQGISTRISQGTSTSFLTATIHCPRVVIVPIVHTLDVPGRKEVEVVGFAAFYLEDQISGKDTYIVGRFMELALDATVGMAPGFGLRAYRLIQ